MHDDPRIRKKEKKKAICIGRNSVSLAEVFTFLDVH